MTQNIVFISLKFVFIDLIGDIIYFPIWWYSRGAKKSALFFWHYFLQVEQFLGVRIWIVNLFKPMYSQNDWQSKLISFFMRVFQIIIRAIALIIMVVVILALFAVWIFLPLLAIYMVLYHLFS